MFRSVAKLKVRQFVDHITILAEGSSDRIVSGFQGECAQNVFLEKILQDTQELIDNNEWGIALENLIDNLYEIGFRVDKTSIDLAKQAIEECRLDYNKLRFLRSY